MPQKQLSSKQIQHGFGYGQSDPVEVIETSSWRGQQELTINCTQLGSAYRTNMEKKRVLTEWCQLLVEKPRAFKVLRFGTRMPQELFEAVCHQVELEDLEINWGVYRDLSSIVKLENLKLLSVGSGAGVQSISPLAQSKKLVGLSLENFQKITDYSALTGLTQLECLSICGDGMGPRYIKVDSLEFLRQMPRLRHLNLLTLRLQSKDYSPLMDLVNLEHLSLSPHRDVKKVYAELASLPKLRWGLLKESPDLYK